MASLVQRRCTAQGATAVASPRLPRSRNGVGTPDASPERSRMGEES